FFFSSRRRHTRCLSDWSSDVCSSDLSDPAREERIFAVSFLAAAPARIAKDVDVGRPKGEAVVAAGISVLYSIVVLGARFGRDDEIGRASCREREEMRVRGGVVEETR